VLDDVELRHELADHDVGARDEQIGHRHADEDGQAVRDPRREDVLERMGDRRLADGADRDRHQRDADLRGRDVVPDVLDLLEDEIDVLRVVLLERLEARLAHADERVLGRHEKRVERDKNRCGSEEKRRHRRSLLRGRSSFTGDSR
jgi:hypothetical protein